MAKLWIVGRNLPDALKTSGIFLYREDAVETAMWPNWIPTNEFDDPPDMKIFELDLKLDSVKESFVEFDWTSAKST